MDLKPEQIEVYKALIDDTLNDAMSILVGRLEKSGIHEPTEHVLQSCIRWLGNEMMGTCEMPPVYMTAFLADMIMQVCDATVSEPEEVGLEECDCSMCEEEGCPGRKTPEDVN